MTKPGVVDVLHDAGRAIITITNPPENRFGEATITEIGKALEKLRHDDHLKLIIFRSGVENMFSMGFDILDRTPDQVGKLNSSFGHLLYLLNELPVLSACEVDGGCYGGSMELAVYCDFLIASNRAVFGHPEIKSGIFPPVAAALYPQIIGRNKTLEVLATGERLLADEAHNMGLVNRLYHFDEFDREVEAFYQKIEATSALTLRLMKKAVDKGLYAKVPEAIQMTENIYLNELLPSHDAREGIQAKLENRDPRWLNK